MQQETHDGEEGEKPSEGRKDERIAAVNNFRRLCGAPRRLVLIKAACVPYDGVWKHVCEGQPAAAVPAAVQKIQQWTKQNRVGVRGQREVGEEQKTNRSWSAFWRRLRSMLRCDDNHGGRGRRRFFVTHLK